MKGELSLLVEQISIQSQTGAEVLVFDSFIMSLGYNRLSSDHCAYYKRFEDNDFIILLLYVDDMLVAGSNKDRIQELKAQLAREFEMKDLGPANKILGMQIH